MSNILEHRRRGCAHLQSVRAMEGVLATSALSLFNNAASLSNLSLYSTKNRDNGMPVSLTETDAAGATI